MDSCLCFSGFLYLSGLHSVVFLPLLTTGFPVGVRSGDEAFFMSSHQDAAQQRPRILMNHNHNKSFENFWCEDEDTFRECAPSEGQASFNSLQNEDTFMDWSLSEGQASNVAPPDSSADEEDPMEVDQQDVEGRDDGDINSSLAIYLTIHITCT
ncbi:uncharacterized protein [Trachinotus anak]|uniref:uncharacterized protein isoform X6 n=1 Tax=Trachinotus anak TaxID=443729 RepID=UPI0039F2596B